MAAIMDRVQAAPAPRSGRLGRWIDAYASLSIKLGAASGTSTMLLMLIIVPDVLLRKLFSVTIPLATEIAVLLLMGKVYLGLAGAQASNANFAVTAYAERLSPPARRLLRTVHLGIALVVFALLAWFTSGEAIRSTLSGETSFGVTPFPVWPGRILLAVGLCLLTLQLAFDLLRAALGLPERRGPREGDGRLH